MKLGDFTKMAFCFNFGFFIKTSSCQNNCIKRHPEIPGIPCCGWEQRVDRKPPEAALAPRGVGQEEGTPSTLCPSGLTIAKPREPGSGPRCPLLPDVQCEGLPGPLNSSTRCRLERKMGTSGDPPK